MQDQEVIREFLVESHENLWRPDRELVELEKHPKDAAPLASIFRTIHTIKSTCGFLAFTTLERISHQAENLLSQLRDGQRELTPSLVSLILETVDVMKTGMQPIGMVWKKLPRVMRDMALGLGKQIRLEMDGNLTRPSSRRSRTRWSTWFEIRATTALNRRGSGARGR